MTDWPFTGLERGKYGAIYADPPWAFPKWSGLAVPARGAQPYQHMTMEGLSALPVGEIAAKDSVLFCWVTWPMLLECLAVIESWGFKYKTCGFAWVKANAGQIDMFRDDLDTHMTLGYWTRSNSEVCLIATRGEPKRVDAGVRQAIVEPRREHSRKPDCVYDRIERLVAGPYCELFARNTRKGWDSWGNQVGKYGEAA